jgi:hypothetical protein
MEPYRIVIPTTSERIVSVPDLNSSILAPTDRVHPIQHRLARSVTVKAMCGVVQKVTGEFHMLSHNDMRYLGIFSGMEGKEIEWIIAVSNYGDGFRVMELHSGFVVHSARSIISFHATLPVFSRYCYRTPEELQLLVNEKVGELRQHYNLEFERMNRWKDHKLTRADGHDVICLAIKAGAIAGRVASEFIKSWNEPACDYFKPRTLWSLFCLTSSFLNRLTAPPIIERTIALHDFFDGISGFNLKPTPWVQQTLI